MKKLKTYKQLFENTYNFEFFIAIENRDLDRIKEIVEKKDFDINIQNMYENNGLLCLIGLKNDKDIDYDIAKYLINNGIDINLESKTSHENLLMTAISKRKNKIVELLLEEDDINVDNFGIYNAIYYASWFNLDIKLAEKIIKKGCDINISSYHDITPLMKASLNEDMDMIKMLIDYDADWNLVDNEGDTFLDILHLMSNDKYKKIKSLYPEKYKEYVKNKKVGDFNL